MTQFLAIIRRIFWLGIISLLVCLFLLGISFQKMLDLALVHDSVQGFWAIYFLISPILFFLFTVISVAYIRKYGQFASTHQEHSPVLTFFQCFCHDIFFPFKNTWQFLGALFNKDTMGRGIIIGRFIGTVVLIIVCAVGILLLM